MVTAMDRLCLLLVLMSLLSMGHSIRVNEDKAQALDLNQAVRAEQRSSKGDPKLDIMLAVIFASISLMAMIAAIWYLCVKCQRKERKADAEAEVRAALKGGTVTDKKTGTGTKKKESEVIDVEPPKVMARDYVL